MRLLPLGLLCIVLVACSPAYVTAPAGGEAQPRSSLDGVLPVEAQRVIDHATATAAAQATQNAQATATGQSARETATAASLGTLAALAGQQTEVALSLTQSAGQAAATDAAAGRTQNARSTAAWATPTAQALKTQAAAALIDTARQQAQAANVAEFWRSVRFIVLALLIVGGLTSIVVVVVDRLASIHTATLREKAAIAREAFRLLPPGHWAEWQPAEGYQVYQLPGALNEPATIIDAVGSATTTPNTAHEWRQALRLFCWWGDRYGFGIRELGPTGAGVVSDPDWRALSKMLKAAGVLADVTIPGRKGKATGWAPEWGYTRLHDELGHGPLALPFPPDTEAPKVAFTVPNTTPQDAQHNTATQKG